MSAQFTAGPWMAAAAPSSIVGWPIVGPGGRSIASVSWSPNHWQAPAEEYEAFVAECGANAKLIGAAPDMIDALERLRKGLDLLDPSHPLQYADTMDLMRKCADAAIAKGRGAA